jgi:tetratricopeptide (TPR) repeat protein
MSVVRVLRAGALPVILALCLAGDQPSAQRLSVTELLDRYAAGEFEAVSAILATKIDFNDLLKQLQADGPAWMAANGSGDLERRELAAATFALEAARADEWNEWSRRQRQPPIMDYVPPDVFSWSPPPLLIEWGCQLFGRDATPRPVERLWQLAALAVAERAEDADFLIGIGGEQLATYKRDTMHLKHALTRFPNEPRFKLAHGIALEWRTWPQRPRTPGSLNAQRSAAATKAFEALETEEEIAAEVSLRLGVLHLRQRQLDEALKRFERVESSTREPYLIYLARYFTAQAFEARGREADAMRAYGRALATVPHAQSAALPYAALLFKADRRADAYAVVEGALGSSPLPADPWRGYADADDRFWPGLLAQLRALIHS